MFLVVFSNESPDGPEEQDPDPKGKGKMEDSELNPDSKGKGKNKIGKLTPPLSAGYTQFLKHLDSRIDTLVREYILEKKPEKCELIIREFAVIINVKIGINARIKAEIAKRKENKGKKTK